MLRAGPSASAEHRSPPSRSARSPCRRAPCTPRATPAVQVPRLSATPRPSPGSAARSPGRARAPRSTLDAREEARQVREVRQDGDHGRHRRDAAPRRLHAAQGVQERGEEDLRAGGVRLPGCGCAGDVLRGEARERQAEGEGARRRRSASTRRTARCVRHACYASPFGARRLQLRRHQLRAPRWSCRRRSNIPSARAAGEHAGQPGRHGDQPEAAHAVRRRARFSLNNARYTRHFLAGPAQQPDAILILVPGLRGRRVRLPDPRREPDHARQQQTGLVLEVWAFDRRTNQLEDRAGLDIAEEFLSPEIALDWLFGGELGAAARPAPDGGTEPPRGLLRHAGRRPVHGQLDEPRLLARHRRRRDGGARGGAQPERLPRRPLGRHRLHGALRRRPTST